MEPRYFSDRTGDLIFYRTKNNPPVGFIGIPDVARVGRILTTMRDERLNTPGYSEPMPDIFNNPLLKILLRILERQGLLPSDSLSDDSKQPPNP
jgi:hypothetical protein